MRQPDAEYYAARAMAERRLSAAADDVRGARAHTLLDERYQALAAGCAVGPKPLQLIQKVTLC